MYSPIIERLCREIQRRGSTVEPNLQPIVEEKADDQTAEGSAVASSADKEDATGAARVGRGKSA